MGGLGTMVHLECNGFELVSFRVAMVYKVAPVRVVDVNSSGSDRVLTSLKFSWQKLETYLNSGYKPSNSSNSSILFLLQLVVI